MSEKTLKKVHLIYNIVMSLVMVSLAIVCILMCYDIYKMGNEPFTRERVYDKFMSICALVYVFIDLILAGAILNIFCPLEKKRLKGSVNERLVLDRLYKKATIGNEAKDKIEKQRILRLVMIIISSILLVGATLISIISVPKSIDTGSLVAGFVNEEIAKASLSILAYFATPLIYTIVTIYVCKSSVKKEIDIVKGELKSQATENKSSSEEEKNQDNQDFGTFTKLTNDINNSAKRFTTPKKWHKYASLVITCALLVVSVTFIILGIFNGNVSGLFTKAVNICTECIGMG